MIFRKATAGHNSSHPPKIPNSRQIVNLLKTGISLGLSRVSREPLILGSPIMLMVEPTTACQLKCPHCPTGRGELNRPEGRMKFEQFKFLWDSIQPTPLLLQLWNQGEPLLNPELAKIVNYAASQNCWVTLSSNVELLADRHKADSLVQSGLYELILSLDGASKETYSQYRVGGDFERVWIGIQNVVQSRKLNRSKYPIITWQYLLFKHTLAEVEKAKRLAKEWGVDKIVFKTAQLEDLSKSEGQRWLPDQSELRRYDLKKDRWQLRRSSNYFCKRIFSSAVIQWDGTVVPCCFDKTGEFIVGDAAVVGFPVVWSGKEFQAFRRNWLRGIRPEICSNCTEGLKNLYVNPRFVEI